MKIKYNKAEEAEETDPRYCFRDAQVMEQQKQKTNSLQQWKLREIHLLPIFLHILFIFSAPRLTSTIAGFLDKRH